MLQYYIRFLPRCQGKERKVPVFPVKGVKRQRKRTRLTASGGESASSGRKITAFIKGDKVVLRENQMIHQPDPQRCKLLLKDFGSGEIRL